MSIITGHHHISMLTKNAQRNNHFYRDILGLRRVKKTVNQDSPTMYHLFYGDLTGAPGTELTFFEMPSIGRTLRGTNAITQIGLLVPSLESLHYWQDRFDQLGINHWGISSFGGRDALHFEDEEGLRLILINHRGETVPEQWAAWPQSDVEEQHRILGMGPIEITVRNLDKLASLLTEQFGYSEVSRNKEEAVYQAVAGQAYGEIVIRQQDGPTERPGKGSIHHLAIRVKDEEELRNWEQIVQSKGYANSGIVDRFYFQSLYFRESNGILFELATDGPGFLADASLDSLGEALDLPPFLEAKRAEIEAALTPLD